MKRSFGILALLMALLMVFAACGGGAATTPTTTAAAASTAAPAESTAAAPAATEEPKGPPTELVIAWLVTGANPADQALVEEALNKVVTPKINATVKLMPVNFGAAMQQQNLMLSSNEKVDLMMTFPYTYQMYAAQGKIQEIGPLLDQYGQGVKDALGGFLQGSILNGKIYGTRPISDLGGGGGLCIRKDVIDKYKIDVSNLNGLQSLTPIFKTIKDNEPNTSILTYSGQNIGMVEFDMQFHTDKLSDNFGVLLDSGKELKVVDLYTSQMYVDAVNLMRDWYQKGYIMKNVATAKEDQYSLIKAGKAIAYLTPTKPGISIQESAKNGTEMIVPQYSQPQSNTSNITLFQWVVPNGSTAPDKAVQMLNLMYSDADVMNILAWGIEGKHYEKKADGVIGFPAGMDNNNSGWFPNTPWMMGNEFLTYVWEGNPPSLWKDTKEFNDSCIISKAMGFTYDQTPVKTEVAALTNIYNQYKLGLESGSVDPAKVLPQMQKKMKDAGIDKVIAEKQKQLDAWAAENNIK